MKRDWNAIRSILKAIESLPDETSSLHYDHLPDIDPAVVRSHLILLVGAGCVEADSFRKQMFLGFGYPVNLTWYGHELLNAMRTEESWSRIKTAALDQGIDLSFDSVIALNRGIIESLL